MAKKVYSSNIFVYLKEILLGIVLLLSNSLLIFIASPIYLLRYAVQKTSKFCNPSLGEMMTAMGQFIGTEEFGKTSRCAIISTVTLVNAKDPEEGKRIATEKLLNAKISEKSDQLKYPELRQYVTTWLGFRFWKPEQNFSVDDHIIIKRPEQPFKVENVRDLIEELMNEPFPKDKSPWKMVIMDNYRDPSVSPEPLQLAFVKSHHSLADGFGVIFTFIEGISNDSINVPKARFASEGRNFWKTLAFNLTFPFRASLELLTFILLTIRPHPWKVPDSKKAWRQLYGHTDLIPIAKIKQIKNAFGVSFASVVNSAYASATRQSLLKKFGSEGDIECTPCAVILPLPDHPKILRNHATGVLQYLPTMDCDPIERLKICEKDLQAAKKSTFPLLAHFFTVVTGGLTVGLTELLGKNRSFPVGMSNVPVGGMGSKGYEYLGGEIARITVGLGGLPGVLGACFFVYTYGDGIQFTLTVENSLMNRDEVNYFMKNVQREIDTLLESTVRKNNNKL